MNRIIAASVILIFSILPWRLASGTSSRPYIKATYEIPESLIPADALTTAQQSVARFLYQSLFRFTGDLTVLPDLVKDWEMEPDGRTYNLTIKPAKFSTGEKLDAFDVKSSLDYLIGKSRNCRFFEGITGVSAIDDSRLKIFVNSKSVRLIELLSAPQTGIWKLGPDAQVVGSGVMTVISKDQRELRLRKSSRYTGRFPMNLNDLIFRKVDESQIFSEVEAGNVDDSVDIPTSASPPDSAQVVISKSPSTITWILALNASSPGLKSTKLRRCLRESFSSMDFVNKFLPNHTVANGYLPDTMPGGKIENKEQRWDCTVADNHLSVDVPSELDRASEMCRFIEASFSKVVRTVSCRTLPFDELLRKIEAGTHNVSLLGMSLDIPTLDYFVRVFHSKSKFDLSRVRSRDLDSLINQASTVQDKRVRAEVFAKINKLISELALTINVSHPIHVSYRSNKVLDLSVNPLGAPYTDYSKVSLSE